MYKHELCQNPLVHPQRSKQASQPHANAANQVKPSLPSLKMFSRRRKGAKQTIQELFSLGQAVLYKMHLAVYIIHTKTYDPLPKTPTTTKYKTKQTNKQNNNKKQRFKSMGLFLTLYIVRTVSNDKVMFFFLCVCAEQINID